MSARAAPMSTSASAASAGYAFSDADFAIIARCAHADFGLHLPETKKDLVYSRLTKRLRQLGLNDFKTYCNMIEVDGAHEERMQMLSALTTNVTHFFREEHHFQALRETILPPLIKAAKAGQRLRLWSAGCSAGQEPYSLAFTVLGLCPDAANYDIRILATDVDPVIVERAKVGIYDDDELKSLPAKFRERYSATAGNGRFSIGAEARKLVTFAELNLMADWPISGPFDVIFCRNVAIYFDKPTQARLWQRFANLLATDGHLCIGHSERISGPATPIFRAVGVTTYRKEAAGTENAQHKPQNGACYEP